MAQAKTGVLASITQFEVMGIPIGAVAAGAGIGGVGDAVSGILTGFVPQAPTWAVKGAMAFAVGRYGSKILGQHAAQVGTLFLAYDAIQELFNIRASVANIIGGLTGKVVRNSPPRFTGAGTGAKSTGGSYYKKAMGVN